MHRVSQASSYCFLSYSGAALSLLTLRATIFLTLTEAAAVVLAFPLRWRHGGSQIATTVVAERLSSRSTMEQELEQQ